VDIFPNFEVWFDDLGRTGDETFPQGPNLRAFAFAGTRWISVLDEICVRSLEWVEAFGNRDSFGNLLDLGLREGPSLVVDDLLTCLAISLELVILFTILIFLLRGAK